FSDLFSDVVGDILNRDTRLVRTLRPLMLRPGQVAKDYIAGQRVSHVPPLKAYLIAALIFFSLFTVFPSQAPVRVLVQGSAEEPAAQHQLLQRLVPGRRGPGHAPARGVRARRLLQRPSRVLLPAPALRAVP